MENKDSDMGCGGGLLTVFRKLPMFIAVCLLVLGSTVQADPALLSERFLTSTYRLNALSKIETLVMQGNRATSTIYVPVPKDWQVNSLDLNLIVQFSPLLENLSSLTVLVGDVPLDSMFLRRDIVQPFRWKITIPKEFITPKVTTIKVEAWLKTGDKMCQDTENKGNWVTLSGSSEITYHYNLSAQKPALAHFPKPFINQDAPFSDTITLLLPKNLNSTSFFPYFNLANWIAQKASWRGVDFDLRSPDASGMPALQHPTVLAATPADFDFQSIGQPQTLRLQNQTWVTQDGSPLSNDSGFIWLTQYGQQPLLVISANTGRGLNHAIQSIRSGVMRDRATDPSLFVIDRAPAVLNRAASKSRLTFADLGYKDSVVFGTGQNEINYRFNLATIYYGKPIILRLIYSHSPFLDKSKISSLGISLNGIPIGGTRLVADSADIDKLRIELPSNLLNPGKNTLTVNYLLALSNAWCSKEYLDQAWGTIYQGSSLEFQRSDSGKSTIRDWPSLMSGNVLVTLPSGSNDWKHGSMLKNLIDFATQMGNATSLELQEAPLSGKPADSAAQTHNRLFFVTADTPAPVIPQVKSIFQKLLDSLRHTENPVLLDIDKPVFENAFLKSQGTGFAVLWNQPARPDINTMTLYGYTAMDLDNAIRLLNNGFKRKSLKGDLAVAFQNGSYTSLSPNEIRSQQESEQSMQKVTRITWAIGLYAVIGLLVIIIVFGILRLFIRIKKHDKPRQ